MTIEQAGDGTYHTFYDRMKGDVTVTIALALGEATGMDPTEVIPEFKEYADPDALDRLFRKGPNGEGCHPESWVHLSIEGIDVTIHSDSLIELDP